jgi:hypothetical protein
MRRLRPVPERIKELVRDRRIRFSGKVEKLLSGLELDREEICEAVLDGTVTKRERDETGQSRWKYTVIGPSRSGRKVYCAGKVILTNYGMRFFVITAHWAKDR